jgi:hypothetical protein
MVHGPFSIVKNDNTEPYFYSLKSSLKIRSPYGIPNESTTYGCCYDRETPAARADRPEYDSFANTTTTIRRDLVFERAYHGTVILLAGIDIEKF